MSYNTFLQIKMEYEEQKEKSGYKNIRNSDEDDIMVFSNLLDEVDIIFSQLESRRYLFDSPKARDLNQTVGEIKYIVTKAVEDNDTIKIEDLYTEIQNKIKRCFTQLTPHFLHIMFKSGFLDIDRSTRIHNEKISKIDEIIDKKDKEMREITEETEKIIESTKISLDKDLKSRETNFKNNCEEEIKKNLEKLESKFKQKDQTIREMTHELTLLKNSFAKLKKDAESDLDSYKEKIETSVDETVQKSADHIEQIADEKTINFDNKLSKIQK